MFHLDQLKNKKMVKPQPKFIIHIKKNTPEKKNPELWKN